MKVRCNYCEWSGEEDDLAFALPTDEPDEMCETQVCPECQQVGYLQDLQEDST